MALGHQNPAALHTAIGDLEALAGAYGSAVSSYQTALALGVRRPRSSGDWLRSTRTSAPGRWRRRTSSQAQESTDAGRSRAGDGGGRACADRPSQRRRRASAGTGGGGTRGGRCRRESQRRANNLLGILRRSKDPEGALDHLITARELAVEAGDPRLCRGPQQPGPRLPRRRRCGERDRGGRGSA